MPGANRPERLWSADARGFATLAIGALTIAGTLEGLGANHHLPTLIVLLGLAWCAVATVVSRTAGRIAVAEIEAPDDCRASSPFVVQVTLRNDSRWLPLMFAKVLLRFESPFGEQFFSVEHHVIFVPPGAMFVREWRIAMRGRGAHRLSAAVVEARVPGSLFGVRGTIGCAHAVLALPALSELRPNAIHLVVGRRMASGRLQALPVAMEEYIGVRDYRPGDNPRLLHRVLSLRNPAFPAELTIREFEDPSIDDVCLVVDHARPADQNDLDAYAYRLEKALCFVAAFSRMMASQKLKSRVVVPGHPVLGESGMRIQSDSAVWRLERELASLTLGGNKEEIDKAVYREARFGNAAVLFVCLGEVAIEARNRRLAILSVLPDTVHALTHRTFYT